MKNIIRYSFCTALALSTFSACNDDVIVPESEVQGGLTITLVSSSHQTKATMDGVESLNENKIDNVYYFFYPEDPDNPSADNTAVEPSHWGVLTNVNAQNEKSIALNVSEDELNNVLFPRPFDECDVYVIVNLPAGTQIGPGTNKTLANLRQIVLNADFVSQETQDLFVMEGLGKAKLSSRTAVLAASGEIPVDRVASKLSLNIQVEESVMFDSKTWKSLPEEMTVEFYNGVSRALLSGDPSGIEPQYFGDARPTRTFTKEGNYWTCSPFYSYPVEWTVGADEEPYLKIVLPWIYEGTSAGGQQFVKQYTYYKVILGGESMVRNTWYDMTVKLSILGNFNDFEDNDVEITTPIHYYVVDWSTGLTVNTDIMGARYLVVENTSYELNNQDVLKIPLSTSHKCEIMDLSVTYPDISSRTPNMSASVTIDDSWSVKIVTEESGNYIEFSHALRNDITDPPFDSAPYNISFIVRHIDEPDSYYREIHIVQNPSIKIEVSPNSDQTLRDSNFGYTYVNVSNNNASGMETNFTDTNSNPNMYVLSVSSFDGASEYIIGDPREFTINNLGQTWSVSRTSIQGNTRRITYYYPTISDVSSENMIAPKFRVASSYGKWSGGTYLEAQQRCASYQEDGYPAGRWRIPTKAEIEFIITASVNDIIPSLFTPDDSNGYAYWCSTGGIYPRTDGSVDYIYKDNTNEHSVRCVYDEWYWEDSSTPTVNKTTFTWGDAAR